MQPKLGGSTSTAGTSGSSTNELRAVSVLVGVRAVVAREATAQTYLVFGLVIALLRIVSAPPVAGFFEVVFPLANDEVPDPAAAP